MNSTDTITVDAGLIRNHLSMLENLDLKWNEETSQKEILRK